MTAAEQRLDALVRANEAKSARAALRRDIKAAGYWPGREMVAALVLDGDERIQRMSIDQLLRSILWVGRNHVGELTPVSVSPHWRVERLTIKQAMALAENLRRRPEPRVRVRKPDDEWVDTAPLREECERRVRMGEITWSGLARQLELGGSYQVKQRLGMRPGHKTKTPPELKRIRYDLALKVMDAIGADPVDVGL